MLAGAIPKKQLMQIQSWLKENEEDGIVYGENRSGMIKILEARHVYGGVLIVKFSNGEVRLFDTTILEGEVFEPLRDLQLVSKIELEHGVVTWNNGTIDCSPEYMYENSYEYNTADIVVAA